MVNMEKKKGQGIRRGMDEKVFRVLSGALILLFSVACLLPFLRVVSEAVSGDTAVASGEILILPKDFTLKQLKFILDTPQFTQGMWVSLSSTVVYTVISIVLTCMLAYPLSRTDLPGRRGLMFYVVFTMLFNGGMVPTYLVVKNLGILNTFWALIIPLAISQFNVIVLVNGFLGIPKEMEESALIDGAGQFTILVRIMVPLAKPTLAAILLFYAVARWNGWFDAVMYVNDRSLFPLPVIIKDLVQQGLNTSMFPSLTTPPPTQAIRSAAVIFSIVPIILVYPFLQKYFVKGVTLGGVKG
ncbi:MAG: carbohydrate ABC transporter permease [Acutalibacter sp.]|nr:carbohydrate ABC transporter permease [Acutalibacter sp.]